MEINSEHDQKIAKITFARVYPNYVNKIEKKGRSVAELIEVIEWLTGYDHQQLLALIAKNVTLYTFFNEANLNPNACLIKGIICGYRIEKIENPITKQIRILDKLVDDLAKGKKMEKILKSADFQL